MRRGGTREWAQSPLGVRVRGSPIAAPPDLQADPQMQAMMSSMQSPEYKSKVEEAMKSLKDDPELGKVFEELEAGGPGAMMKCVACNLV